MKCSFDIENGNADIFYKKVGCGKISDAKVFGKFVCLFLSVAGIYAIILITEIGFETDTMLPQKQVQEQRKLVKV